MKLIVIGCASGMTSANRAHSCYLIAEEDRTYMFDCGGGAASALVRCGIETSRIRDVFISHTHPDHVIGLPMWIQMEHLKGRTEPLRIHVPSEFKQVFSDMLRGLYLFPEKMCFDVSILGMNDDFAFDDGAVRIKVHPNKHLAGNAEFAKSVGARNLMQCYSFTLRTAVTRFAYSADIAGIDDLAPIADCADLLLTEGMHVDLVGLPNLLIDKKVRRCVLTHLPDDFASRVTMNQFAKAGFGNLDFAEEGMILHF